MSAAFEAAFKRLLVAEGEYSDHPSDRGGKTRWGITEAVARDSGWMGDMRDLPLSVAQDIARSKYWDLLSGDEVVKLVGEGVAYQLLQIGYNMGVGWAGQFLQRALNAFNRNGLDYPDIPMDGKIGPRTLASLRCFVAFRRVAGVQALSKAIECQQGTRYLDLVDFRPENEDFVFGWFRVRLGGELHGHFD